MPKTPEKPQSKPTPQEIAEALNNVLSRETIADILERLPEILGQKN